jgi:hypothetical protein
MHVCMYVCVQLCTWFPDNTTIMESLQYYMNDYNLYPDTRQPSAKIVNDNDCVNVLQYRYRSSTSSKDINGNSKKKLRQQNEKTIYTESICQYMDFLNYIFFHEKKLVGDYSLEQ